MREQTQKTKRERKEKEERGKRKAEKRKRILSLLSTGLISLRVNYYMKKIYSSFSILIF